RGPAHDFPRVSEGDAHDPAAILAAIAEMPAERDVERAVENDQCAALVLVARVETLTLGLERLRHVDGPARQDRAVLERESENLVTRAGRALRHGVDIERLALRIDHRRARDPERVDIAAPERRSRDRLAERALPDLRAVTGIERVHLVV